MERVCREGLDRLAALGAEVVTVPAPPSTDEVLGRAVNPYGASDALLDKPDVLLNIVLPELTSYHRRLAAERPHRYSPEIIANIKAGETVSAADYLDAQRLRSVWVRECRELFVDHRLDAVACPTLPNEPIGGHMNAADRAGAASSLGSNGPATDRSVPTPGATPTIPLETEPLVFFHPLLAGSVRPGGVQPVRATVLLEEEPATWPELAT